MQYSRGCPFTCEFCDIIELYGRVPRIHTRKKQNTRRNLADSVHRIYRAGMFVTAGFIVGFDNEEVSMADAMVDFIEESAIPVCMVGLL